MNEGTAIEIARLKMKEQGVNENYIIRYRHFRLDPNEVLKLKAENQLFIMVKPTYWLRVASIMGIYNQRDAGINENQHIHKGLIEMKNNGRYRIDAKFIQVIPLLKQPNK